MGMMQFETETVVNRTKRTLYATFDGDRYPIESGMSVIPRILVSFAKNQNPRMGTQDPYVGSKFESLIGVVAKDPAKQKDPIDPIVEKGEKSVERIDRSKVMGMGRHATSIEGRIFSPIEVREEE